MLVHEIIYIRRSIFKRCRKNFRANIAFLLPACRVGIMPAMGAYFITICTANRYPYFGKINNGTVIYNPAGIIVDVLWHEIKNRYQHLDLGAFVIMPNHLHGILILNGGNLPSDTPGASNVISDQKPIPAKNLHMSAISPKSNSISAIIRSYKSAVTRHANRLKLNFGWQPRFYDHIIRDVKSYDNIHNYILNNPANWCRDKFYARQ